MRGWPALLAPMFLASAAAPAEAPTALPDIDQARMSLVSAKQAATEAQARADALSLAAGEAGGVAERARAQAQALGLQVQAAQADITAARARIALIDGLRANAERRIAEKHGPIIRLVAALQTMARRPPALAIAQPGSIDDIVHVRLLLADTLPVIQARTADLRADLDHQTELRTDAERATQALDASKALLGRRQQQLALLEQTAIRRSERLADQAADEAERALGLGEEARDLADRMQTITDAGDIRARLSRLPDPDLRPMTTADALPAHAGAPRYLLPVVGDVATGFGEVSPSGVRARGLSLAVAPGAHIMAPHAGTVAYAGPFRSYGRIVILSHGGGWTTTITGFDTLVVKVGDRVRQGAMLGSAANDATHITTELRRDNRPIDIVAMAQAG